MPRSTFAVAMALLLAVCLGAVEAKTCEREGALRLHSLALCAQPLSLRPRSLSSVTVLLKRALLPS